MVFLFNIEQNISFQNYLYIDKKQNLKLKFTAYFVTQMIVSIKKGLDTLTVPIYSLQSPSSLLKI